MRAQASESVLSPTPRINNNRLGRVRADGMYGMVVRMIGEKWKCRPNGTGGEKVDKSNEEKTSRTKKRQAEIDTTNCNTIRSY